MALTIIYKQSGLVKIKILPDKKQEDTFLPISCLTVYYQKFMIINILT